MKCAIKNNKSILGMLISLVIAYLLGFSVHPTIWDTRNVILTALPCYAICGAVAILLVLVYGVLRKKHAHTMFQYVTMLAAGVFTTITLVAMWYNCVVEVAFIYGEGNLEIGNTRAVIGSVITFVSTAGYVVAAGHTVYLNSKA